MPDSLGSISNLFQLIQQSNDPHASRELWERYFPRLTLVAKRSLGNLRSPMDAEDAVQDAFINFFQRVEQGRYDTTLHRDDLWRILCQTTTQHASKQRRRQNADKRGGGRVVAASQFESMDSDCRWIEQAVAVMSTAEWDSVFAELIDGLDEELRTVAMMRLAGYSNPEIRDHLGCSLRSVERRIQLVRATWKEMSNDAE